VTMTWRAKSARPCGKARHARVDSSPPRGLQYTHFAEGLERRRHREEAERRGLTRRSLPV